MTVTHRSAPIFVVGLAEDATQPTAAPAANTSTSTMSHQAQSPDLRLQTLQAIDEATFAMNTFNPAGAAKALQKALALAGQLVTNTTFAGYSINATNDGASATPAAAAGGEFAGYDLNNPEGK